MTLSQVRDNARLPTIVNRGDVDGLILHGNAPDHDMAVQLKRFPAVWMVFDALRSRGIEPGKDITVIACDNDPALAGLNPSIATIDVRPDRIDELAVEQLMLRIKKPDLYARNNVEVEPTLVDATDFYDCYSS